MSETRRFVYDLMDLPTHVQSQLAREFGLDFQGHVDSEQLRILVKHTKEAGKLPALAERVAQETQSLIDGGFRKPRIPAAPAEPLLGTCDKQCEPHEQRGITTPSACVNWKPLAEPVPQSEPPLPCCIYCANPGMYTLSHLGKHFDVRGQEHACLLAAPSPAETSQASAGPVWDKPIEKVHAELRAAGIDPDALAARTYKKLRAVADDYIAREVDVPFRLVKALEDLRPSRRDIINETIEIYERGFRENWVVQDVMDSVRALAGPGDAKETKR